MVIKVLNLDKCIAEFGKIGDIDLYPVIVRATAFVQNNAKVYAPVDTGRLRSSIHRKSYKRGKDSYGRVFTNVEYAPYQEFGYSKTTKNGTFVYAGKAYLRRALGEQQETIKEETKRYIKNYSSKYGE